MLVVPIDVVVMVVMTVTVRVGFGGKPFLHVRDFAARVVKPAPEQPVGRCLAFGSIEDGRGRIERAKPGNNSLTFGLVSKVGLGQHDAVGDRGLLHRLDMRIERRLAVARHPPPL